MSFTFKKCSRRIKSFRKFTPLVPLREIAILWVVYLKDHGLCKRQEDHGTRRNRKFDFTFRTEKIQKVRPRVREGAL